jgi:hypothetical protein
LGKRRIVKVKQRDHVQLNQCFVASEVRNCCTEYLTTTLQRPTLARLQNRRFVVAE